MKTDVTFPLENAAWPAFVVETAGTIRHANQAAVGFFGPKLEGETPSLAALWAESGETAEQFLARWERSATAVIPMRYRGKGGVVMQFDTLICPTRDVQRRYVFQLLDGKPAAGAAAADLMALESAVPVSPEPVGMPASPAPSSASGAPRVGTETMVQHKQKLDCALHLARTVALDFNNALTSVLGHVSLLLSQAGREHPWRASLVEVEKAAHRAAEITHQLAAFSRPEKDSGERMSGNLNTLLRRVAEVFRQGKSSNLNWELQLEGQLYAAKYDEAKIQQVFIKVMENSVEALHDAGRIQISTRNIDISEPTQDRTALLNPGSYVCVEISDDGLGIDPSILPRIFEPFFSTKQGHRGLGLAWVYGIVTNHRGGVAVSSQPGRGTSTRIYLPASGRRVADTGGALDDLRGTQTILMVDDEDLLLNMGRVVLGSFGYEVLTANTGAKALEMLEHLERPVDLVITDLVMPQMSGRELIDQIQIRLPGVPVLCSSGFTRNPEGTDTGTFLPKPFTSQELLTRVRQILAP